MAGNGLVPGMTDRTEEEREFRRLQESFADQYEHVFPNPLLERTVIVIPSFSLDREVMEKISGVMHYEERMLCMLLLLRMPRTRVVFVSSTPISDVIIDYYLHLLPGVPARHARERLTLLSTYDGSLSPLSAKILARPRLLARLKAAIPDPSSAHMTCFTVSDLERTLAVQLGIPIFGCDPALLHLGTKSGSRILLRDSGVMVPPGYENLGDERAVAEALHELKHRNPDLKRAVVKLNDGFSGEGNAVFYYGEDRQPSVSGILEALPGLRFEARDMTWEVFLEKIRQMEAVVEEFVEGEMKRSPSAQFRVDPLGKVEVISTHDQLLGGDSSQIFLGCQFPADPAYRLTIQDQGARAARAMKEQGVLGRFGVDFVSVYDGSSWHHYGIEINLRKGGTTHPYLMLQFLTDGTYDPVSGTYQTKTGRTCCYYSSDNIEKPCYRGITPEDLIDIAVKGNVHFDTASQQGAVFHMIGALSEHGKLGALCVGDSPESARRIYEELVAVLDRAAPGTD
ncbi:MAG: peptide ligase PGM1-related protein [Alphaproteobacteria bacterium]